MQKIIEVRRCSAKPRRDIFLARVCLVAVLATGLSGCIGAHIKALPVSAYPAEPVDTSLPSGFSQYGIEKINDSEYRVFQDGTRVTPRKHLEQIVLARAAELSLALGSKYLTARNSNSHLRCEGRKMKRSGKTYFNAGYPTVDIRIKLMGNRPRGRVIDAQKTFEKLRGQIKQFTVTPDQKLNISNNHARECMRRQKEKEAKEQI